MSLLHKALDNETRVVINEPSDVDVPILKRRRAYRSFLINTPRLTWYWMALHGLTVGSMSPLRHVAEHTLLNCIPHLLFQSVLQARILFTFTYIITPSGRRMI